MVGGWSHSGGGGKYNCKAKFTKTDSKNGNASHYFIVLGSQFKIIFSLSKGLELNPIGNFSFPFLALYICLCMCVWYGCGDDFAKCEMLNVLLSDTPISLARINDTSFEWN